jgi:hypothetical protein
LKPTLELRGQLLGKADEPLINYPVQLNISLPSSIKDTNPNLRFIRFTPTALKTQTDSQGNYRFSGLPSQVGIFLSTGAKEPYSHNRFENFYLEEADVKSPIVTRLETKTSPLSLSQRVTNLLRDCRLNNYHALMFLYSPSEKAEQFLKVNLEDSEKHYSYMQFHLKLSDETKTREIQELAQRQSWPLPNKGKIVVIVLDGKGTKLGVEEFDPNDKKAVEAADTLSMKYQPAKNDAKKKWEEAFAEAKASGRKVWVRVGQRYCGPCFRLTRWMDDQRDLLQKDYVMLKIDDIRDIHGEEIAKLLPGSEGEGIPYHAIFDTDGKAIVTSKGNLGNIGFISGIEGRKHLRKMLTLTRSHLTDPQIEEILSTIKD